MNVRPHRPRTQRPAVREDEPREPPARPPQPKAPNAHTDLVVTLWAVACLLAVWLLYSWMFERMFSN
jgi:hypothetical protein